MAMMSIVTRRTAAFGMMGTTAPMPLTMKRRRWNIGTRIDKMNFRGDTVATRRGREFERDKGRMETGGSCDKATRWLDVLKYGPTIRSGQSPRFLVNR